LHLLRPPPSRVDMPGGTEFIAHLFGFPLRFLAPPRVGNL